MKKIFLIAAFIILSLNVLLAQKKEKTKSVEVTYESATFYVGQVVYFFKRVDNKEELSVGVTNKPFDAEMKKKIKVPKGMLEDTKDIEGLPGANPAMVGKKFLIVYDNEGDVVRIVHNEKKKKK
ncbi:MAG: hypothetical protein EAZ44_05465 [Cytophagia bacterium]|nr:MAG: hypothetical protein EAZ44_05465 [Cytophagia bacterium]TAG43310.1 MAG: hypothetical protein EAZ31_04525 [Cytophagia bacterium]